MSYEKRRRRSYGREATRAERTKLRTSTATFIDRKIPYFEILSEEGLQLIETNAETVLEEIGIEFKDFPQALSLFKEAGADVDGERVRFPRGLCRSIVQASAPREYMQHARNPARSTMIGGDRTVLVPAYGSPFVRDLDNGRRYATLEDFPNFVKLAYMSPGLHHSGGTVASLLMFPSTSATSIWFTATSSTATSHSWARLRRRNGHKILWTWRRSFSAKSSSSRTRSLRV
jgi:trimethylamine--corrinoid protein Co-methyltransferase